MMLMIEKKKSNEFRLVIIIVIYDYINFK